MKPPNSAAMLWTVAFAALSIIAACAHSPASVFFIALGATGTVALLLPDDSRS
jgi:hypothetical protein